MYYCTKESKINFKWKNKFEIEHFSFLYYYSSHFLFNQHKVGGKSSLAIFPFLHSLKFFWSIHFLKFNYNGKVKIALNSDIIRHIKLLEKLTTAQEIDITMESQSTGKYKPEQNHQKQLAMIQTTKRGMWNTLSQKGKDKLGATSYNHPW